MPAVLRAQRYVVGRCVGGERFEDENGLVFDHVRDVDCFVYAGDGEEIDVGRFQDVDDLGDAVAVGIGLNDGTEFCGRRTEGFEIMYVAQQGL